MLASVARSSIDSVREPGPAELHDAVERHLLLREVQQDVEHHVLGGDVRARACPVSSKRIDSGTVDEREPGARSAPRTRSRPTPQASALLPPPMQVWLSVAWMKSPGSMNFSRATWWQMPGETPSRAE